MEQIITKLKVWNQSRETRIPVNGEIYYKCLECFDTGLIIVDKGYCGACEVCGSREEHEVPCPYCNSKE